MRPPGPPCPPALQGVSGSTAVWGRGGMRRSGAAAKGSSALCHPRLGHCADGSASVTLPMHSQGLPPLTGLAPVHSLGDVRHGVDCLHDVDLGSCVCVCVWGGGGGARSDRCTGWRPAQSDACPPSHACTWKCATASACSRHRGTPPPLTHTTHKHTHAHAAHLSRGGPGSVDHVDGVEPKRGPEASPGRRRPDARLHVQAVDSGAVGQLRGAVRWGGRWGGTSGGAVDTGQSNRAAAKHAAATDISLARQAACGRPCHHGLTFIPG